MASVVVRRYGPDRDGKCVFRGVAPVHTDEISYRTQEINEEWGLTETGLRVAMVMVKLLDGTSFLTDTEGLVAILAAAAS